MSADLHYFYAYGIILYRFLSKTVGLARSRNSHATDRRSNLAEERGIMLPMILFTIADEDDQAFFLGFYRQYERLMFSVA